MKLVIQIPCYNEEKSLPVVLKSLPEHIDGIDEIEVVVIDDGSSDNTVEAAKQLGVKHFAVLSPNRGLAKAFIAGLEKSLEIGADIIVNTDADNQYDSADIEKLIQPILKHEADIVIGTRPVEKIKHFSFLKKVLQKFGSAVMRFISSTSVKDAPSGFRAFSRNAALQLNVFDNYTYTLETIIQARAKGLQLVSVPVHVNPELRKSRLVRSIFDYIRRSVFTMLRMFIVYRPFRFFITLSAISLFFGLCIGGRFLWFFFSGQGNGHIQSLILASILLLTGVQIGLIAVLAELISINRRLMEDVQKRLKLLDLKNNQDVVK